MPDVNLHSKFYIEVWIHITVWYLTCGSWWEYVSLIPYSVLVRPLTTAHMKAFSLTQMHRNLFIGRSSAAGLLPQAEAPWSPWQPHHSGGQHKGGVSRAAALSHGPAALIREIAAAVVLSFDRPSITFLGVFVCERASGCFFQASCDSVCSTCLGEHQSHRPPEGPKAWCFRVVVRNF